MTKCQDARKRLYLSKSTEIVYVDLKEASSHVRECHECGEFFDGERRFSSMLREAFRKDQTPQELKESVLGELKKVNKSQRKIFRVVAIAASFLIILILGFTLDHFFYRQNPSIISDVVDDHIQFMRPSDMHIQSSDDKEIRAWFRGKVDFPLYIPHLAAKLTGGRLCFLHQKRLVLLFYEHKGSRLSLFITSEFNSQALKKGKEVIINGKRVYLSEDRGYHVVVWQEEGLNHVLVSELKLKEIEKLIQEV